MATTKARASLLLALGTAMLAPAALGVIAVSPGAAFPGTTAVTSAIADPASQRAPAAGEYGPVLTIFAGGDRTAATSVAGLAGETFTVYSGTRSAAPGGPDGAVGTCTTDETGSCTVPVPGAGSGAGYWVAQSGLPGGWFASSRLGTGRGAGALAGYSGQFAPGPVASSTPPPAPVPSPAGQHVTRTNVSVWRRAIPAGSPDTGGGLASASPAAALIVGGCTLMAAGLILGAGSGLRRRPARARPRRPRAARRLPGGDARREGGHAQGRTCPPRRPGSPGGDRSAQVNDPSAGGRAPGSGYCARGSHLPAGSPPRDARARFPGGGSRAGLDPTVPLARDGGTVPFRADGAVPAGPRPGGQGAGGRATTRPEPQRPRSAYPARPPQ